MEKIIIRFCGAVISAAIIAMLIVYALNREKESNKLKEVSIKREVLQESFDYHMDMVEVYFDSSNLKQYVSSKEVYRLLYTAVAHNNEGHRLMGEMEKLTKSLDNGKGKSQ